MNFDKAPEIKKETALEEGKNIVKWSNPDGTIGSGTEEDRKNAVENWDNN
ncbi:MAG: hypothetical protein ACJAV6_000536 [Candidatus Paceibacteria bacterium]|jgi:hypothetical protein